MIQLALRERLQVDKKGSAFVFCVLLGFRGLAFDYVFGAIVRIGICGAHGCYVDVVAVMMVNGEFGFEF